MNKAKNRLEFRFDKYQSQKDFARQNVNIESLIPHTHYLVAQHKTLQKMKHLSWYLAFCQHPNIETFRQLIM
jgi:hypothetical protein